MILAGYFCRRIAIAVGLLWLALTFLIVVLETLGESGDAPLSVALTLALLYAPRFALETLPFACAIGAAAALRQMDEKRELQTMRAAGVSLARLAFLSASGGVVFALAFMMISEMVLEPSESFARAVRGDFSGRGNLWLQHDGAFVHARRLLPNGGLSEVTVYRPSTQKLMVVSAPSAQRRGNDLLLVDGDIAELSRDAAAGGAGLSRRSFDEYRLPFPAATTAALKAIARRPREMSMHALAGAAQLEQNTGGVRYAAAFWRRWWSVLAPPLLTAGGVWVIGQSRRRRILTAVLAASILGGAYYFFAVICAQFAALWQMPLLNALPLLLLAVVVIVGASRRFT